MILNRGDAHSGVDLADTASAVSERDLDVDRWYVHKLFEGDALIVRGEPPPTLEPQINLQDSPRESPGEDDKWREAQVRVRQGQTEFRGKLLEAYERRCAVTGTRLEPLLQAAHIIPHADGTDYKTSYGLLLRADIHSLYDLHHLSIDERGVVHLSRMVIQTEYRQYEGKTFRIPVKVSLQPSPTSLGSRHQRFLERERDRL